MKTNAKNKTIMTKVKGGFRALPVISASEIPPEKETPITFQLHCGHVKLTYENITPNKATKILEYNNINRKLNQALIEQYSKDMKAGNWNFCTAPIVIYDKNDVADGQHRLWAVIDSGCSQKFIVARDLRQAEGLNIDVGKPRTVVDGAKISGLAKEITSTLVSAARSIDGGVPTHTRSSNAEKLRIVDKHRAAAHFAISHIRGKNIANGAVMGAVGRAWYKIKDKDKLLRYCEVLRTGHSNGIHESAAVTMRNYLLSSNANVATSALWYDTFKRVQRTIQAFVADKQLLTIRAQDKEIYSL